MRKYLRRSGELGGRVHRCSPVKQNERMKYCGWALASLRSRLLDRSRDRHHPRRYQQHHPPRRHMDEAESLEALSNILTSISETPYDFSLHIQHINVAEALGEDQQDQALSAREMMTGFWAAGEEVWFPLINAKKASVDLDTEEGVAEVLELYEKAEDDYLCEPRTSATISPVLNLA